MTATLDRDDEDVARRSGVAHRKLILGGSAVVVVAAIAVWLLAFSSVFGVSTVAVRGVHRLSAGQIRAAAEISSGTPLVRLDTESVRARVEALPDVASATVSTSFPSTVTIEVTERVGLGVVRAATGGFMLVDRTGDQFRHVPQRPKHLPLLVVPDGTDARTTGGAAAIVAADLPAKVRAHVASIQALDPTAITLLMHNGRVVRWGGPERSADKARILPALLRQQGSLIDVTDPDQPYLRP
ncbi:MAG TPA: FtsQ-type POTRA domain-containing protein [Jatrophihabitans sp.]|jgi:cell division protein FtsQ